MAQYKLLKVYDASGDLSKDWFVKYQYLKPEYLRKSGEPLYERFKIAKTINIFHTEKERRDRLKIVLKGMKILLDRGFSPYKTFNQSSNVDQSMYSLECCVEKYLSDIEGQLDKETLRKYKSRLKLFKAWFKKNGREGIMLYNISKTDISNFLADTKKESWSNKTYNHYLTDTRTFFNHFRKNYENYCDKNPADFIKKLRIQKKGNRPFANNDLKRVLEYAERTDKELYVFVKFLYYSCCRPDSEARHMQRGWFDLRKRSMMVPAHVSKNGVTQYVPIDDEFYKLLVDELKIESIPDDHCIFGTDYKPDPLPIYAKAYSRKFLAVKKALNIPEENTMYAFKHTRACHLAEDEVPLYRIQDVTRHLTLAALMDYLKDMNAVIGKREHVKSRAI